MTYTPGPWDIHEANDRNDAFYITHKNRRGIGSISNSFNDDGGQYTSAEDAANARLIAASPDLILALKEWISMAVNSGLEGCDEILEQAEAAIDKAEGQEQDRTTCPECATGSNLNETGTRCWNCEPEEVGA